MTEVNTDAANRWRATLIACGLLFAVLLVLFRETAAGMVYVWYHFETYTHGFIILPISLWLIWQKRHHLAQFTPQPSPAFLVLVAGGLGAWALARLTGVLVVEQAAFVGTLIAAMAAVMGWQVSKFLAFPLLFLFFAVPMGEDLVPPMMEFTATFTVEALRLTGIPVYREGLWFSLPSGNWSVVEACSGVRYLIASITLGIMYAYITYHTLWKRLLFILMSAVVPIIANGLRAYMIVMIGHLSKMEYATGVDHLVYGWVFFGIVMFLLFWIGSYWQEEQPPPAFVPPPRSMSSQSVVKGVSLVTAIILAATVGTVLGTQRAMDIGPTMAGELRAPDALGNWRRSERSPDWMPAHQPTNQLIAAHYTRDGAEAQAFVVLFPAQHQGNEAISPENRIAGEPLRLNRLPGIQVALDGADFKVNRFRLSIRVDGRVEDHLVWQWYRVAGRALTNRYEGKAWEAISRIVPGRADGAWIAVTTPLQGADVDAADRELAQFAARLAPAVADQIDQLIAQRGDQGRE